MSLPTLEKNICKQRDLDFYLNNLRRCMPELKKKYAVKSLGVFGSYVRKEQIDTSDIDILIDFEKPIGLIAFIGLETFLSENLKIKVDLVSKGALYGKIGQTILSEVIYL
jgi:hypothetical protein